MTEPAQDWWKAHNSLRENVVSIDKRVEVITEKVKHVTENLERQAAQTAEMFGRIEQQGISTHGAIDNIAEGQYEIEKTLLKSASVAQFLKSWVPWGITIITAVVAAWQYAGK